MSLSSSRGCGSELQNQIDKTDQIGPPSWIGCPREECAIQEDEA